MHLRWLCASVIPLALAGVACGENPVACSGGERTFLLQVHTPGGSPVLDATLSLQFHRTGTTMTLPGPAYEHRTYEPGVYVVFGDPYHERVAPWGDSVTLHVGSPGGAVSLPGFITSDACHVEGVGLPTSVELPAT